MYFFSNSPVKWRLTKVVCLPQVSYRLKPIMNHGRLDFSMRWLMPLDHTSRLYTEYLQWPQAERGKLGRGTDLSSTTISDQHKLEGGRCWCAR